MSQVNNGDAAPGTLAVNPLLTLICCGATRTARHGGFAHPAEPLDEPGRTRAARLRLPGSAVRSAVVSPSRAARQTAAASGLAGVVSPALADIDWGDWTGRSFDAVHAEYPDALLAWLADPEDGTPGGESLAAARDRVEPWLGEVAAVSGQTVAITHPMVVRLILGLALGMPVAAAMRIDLAPLSLTQLSFHRGWRLRELRRR